MSENNEMENGGKQNKSSMFGKASKFIKQSGAKMVAQVATGLSDAEIETEILFYCLKRGKIIVGIEYFPFKMLGYTTDYVQEARGVTEAMAQNVAKAIREYLGEGEPSTPYQKQTYNRLMVLENFMEENWG